MDPDNTSGTNNSERVSRKPLIGAAIALLLFFCCAQPLFAQAGPEDTTCKDVVNARNKFKHVVFLFGDSIFRGWALKKFSDQFTDEEKNQEILYELRSPATMLRFILPEDYTVVYAGGSGQPNTVSASIAAMVNKGAFRKGDFVFFEDAGDHLGDPDVFIDNYVAIRKLLCPTGAKVFFLNTYDAIPPGRLAVTNEDIYRWDIPFHGMTMNEAVARAATRHIPECPEATLVDVKSKMQEYVKKGHSVTHSDGIHPNITGQWIISSLISHAIMDAKQ